MTTIASTTSQAPAWKNLRSRMTFARIRRIQHVLNGRMSAETSAHARSRTSDSALQVVRWNQTELLS